MRIRDILTGTPLQSLDIAAKGYAWPQRGGGASASGTSYYYDGDGYWMTSLARPTSAEYATVRVELSSALAVVLNTISNAFPEADLCVERETDDGEYEVLRDDPAYLLIDRPNPYMSGPEVMVAVVRDLLTSASGSAYLVKRRVGSSVRELWPVPSSSMRPVWPAEGDVFISAYEITLDSTRRLIDPKDVIHFRTDIDHAPPSYGRCGVPYLPPVMQDLYVDIAAGDFTAAIMRNMGMPGAIISPKTLTDGRAVTLPPEVRDQFAADYQRRFTGAGRGRALVTGNPIDVHQLGFDPEKMSLRDIRQIVEERLSALYNVPAIVAGFGAGLEHATYANYEQAQKAFWNGCIIPLQRRIARTLTDQLLDVDFSGNGRYFEFRHDHIAALQESETDRRARDREDYLAGILTHHQAVERLGLEPEGPDFYLTAQSVQVTAVGSLPDVGQPLAVDARAAAASVEKPATDIAISDDSPKRLYTGEQKANTPDVGRALAWTDDQIDAEAIITDEDVREAEATIRERSPDLADLLDAEASRKGVESALDVKATFRWNPRTRRYIGSDGRMVPKARVKAAVDEAVEASRDVMAGYAERLIEGKMSLVDYQLAMRDEIKAMHLAAHATARGGWRELSASERGRAAVRIREQYKYLNEACLAIERGERKLDGRFRASARMYASSARASYGEADYTASKDAQEAEADTHEERWERSASDSCSGCVEQEDKGWVPLGSLPEIGSQDCESNCKCSKNVRKKPRR